jgi:HEAT repeat protein
MLPDRQLDLFAGGGVQAPAPAIAPCPGPAASALDDAALIAAIPDATLRTCQDLAAEAAARRLTGAVPALEALCRRFKGFGLAHPVPEQMAAVRAIGAIGGREAAQALARIVTEQVVQGPGIDTVLREAARLRQRLPDGLVADLLRHPDPAVRADAAGCAYRPQPGIVAILVELLGDLHPVVAQEAACALGRMGQRAALPILSRLLREQPSAVVIRAVAGVADDACIVLLGRIARTRPDLAEDALDALRDIDSPRAAALVAAIARETGRPA